MTFIALEKVSKLTVGDALYTSIGAARRYSHSLTRSRQVPLCLRGLIGGFEEKDTVLSMAPGEVPVPSCPARDDEVRLISFKDCGK